MKKLILILLTLAAVLAFSACREGEEPPEDLGLLQLFGNWATADKSYELRINDVGQVWYFSGGEQLFRGYFEEIKLEEGDAGYEFYYRYDLYTDAGELMLSYYHDFRNALIYEVSAEGETLDEYGYIGEFSLD